MSNQVSAAAVDYVASVIGNDPLVNSDALPPDSWDSVETSTKDTITVPADPAAAPIKLDIAKRAKFTAPRKAILEALAIAKTSAARRSYKPALASIRLSINGTVRLSAFDGEQSADVNLDFEREGEAEILVSPKQLADMLKAEKSADVSMMIDGDELKAGYVTIPAAALLEDFPVAGWKIDPADIVAEFYCDAQRFAEAVKRTEFAIDPNSSRYALGGVYLEAGANGVRLSATDGSRLSVCDVGRAASFSAVDTELKPVRGDRSKAVSYVVPVATLNRVAQAVGKNVGDVHVIAHNSPPIWNDSPRTGIDSTGKPTEEKHVPDAPGKTIRLTFRIVGRDGIQEFTTLLIDGRFPDYRACIPANFSAEFTFDGSAMLAALKPVQAVGTCEKRGAVFQFGEHCIEASAKTENGSARGLVQCAGPAGKPIKAGFDPRYIVEFLASLPKGAIVTWKMIDADSAAVLEFGDTRYVVMPLSMDR